MSAIQPLCDLFPINIQKLSKMEMLILEAELFIHVCDALKNIIRAEFQDYFCLIKLHIEKEEKMLETQFIRCVIKDILSTEEYTLTGIACYTHTPEDVIYEIMCGQNTNPTLLLARKIIDLHRSVRPDLYRSILGKVTHPDPLIPTD